MFAAFHNLSPLITMVSPKTGIDAMWLDEMQGYGKIKNKFLWLFVPWLQKRFRQEFIVVHENEPHM